MFLFLLFSLQMVWRPSSSMVWRWTHWPWNGAGSRTQVSTMHCRLLNQAWNQAINTSCESPLESFKLSFNTLCPSDAIWHHRPESALAQVMAWHQAITWTNVDTPLVRSWGIYLGVISQAVLKLLFCIMSLKISSNLMMPGYLWTYWEPDKVSVISKTKFSFVFHD